MLNVKRRILVIACGMAIAVLAMPASSFAGLFDCLFGHCPLCAACVRGTGGSSAGMCYLCAACMRLYADGRVPRLVPAGSPM